MPNKKVIAKAQQKPPRADRKVAAKSEKSSAPGKLLQSPEMHGKVDDPAGAKQRLLEAATKLFAERGLEGTSVRDIASEAGLNLSLVSYYFGGKEALYKELIRGFATVVRDQIQTIVDLAEAEELSHESLVKVFTLIVNGMSEIRSNHSAMSLVMQRERLAGLPYGREIHDDIFTPLGLSLQSFIQKAQKKGLVKKDLNPLLVFIFLQEAIIGFHNLVHCDLKLMQHGVNLKQNFKDFQNQLVQIFVKGIFT